MSRKNRWNFKTIQTNQRGETEFINLSSKQKGRIEKYAKALEIAEQSSVANPPFSNYFVKESIGFADGELVPAGNIEYGVCQALHGEESAVAAFRARYGRKNAGEIILGIITGAPGNIATPCGNCRDIMLEDLGTDFEIVSGTADGGTAVIANMNNYLFSDFQKISTTRILSRMQEEISTAIREGESLVNDAYSPRAIHPERRYHALIRTQNNTYVGARDIMCEYHPIYALRDAVRQARRANDPFIRHVIIVCEDFGGGAPHIMYKDRQHLMELNLQAELLTRDNMIIPPVFLATYDAQKRVTEFWQTDIYRWLPFAFTPRNFGPEFIQHLTNYYKNLQRQ